MFMDNLLPVSPVCTKLDLSPFRRGRFRGGHNLAPSAPTTDTCPLPSLPGSPYHGCRSGPCHIAGPNQDQPLRPVTCRDQTPPQPRILQPSLACCRRPKMGRNGTEWYRIRNFRPFLPPLQPRILQPSLACYRCPKMGRNGTEFEKSGLSSRRQQALPIIAAAPTLARAARSSGIGQGVPYRWLQDHRFRHELTRLRPNTAGLARYELRGLMLRFDETSTQLLADTRPPLPAQPERPQRQDYEYHRAGARNLFLACEPLAGWRHVAVTERRTMQDFAHQMRWLVDEAYPQIPVIRVVLDNLNTHRTASLYETFPAVEARRVAKRLEFHHTPKHGSWLNPVLSLPKGWRKSSSACCLAAA